MQYRKLGTSGVKLSTIGLGSYLTYGYKVDDDTARDCLRFAVEKGVNFIDTANAYNRGGAEEALGRLLQEYPRDSCVLATKVWAPMGNGPNDRGLSRKHLFEQCHASLKRLRTDYIDLYQFHRFDPETPLDESLRAIDDLCRQGKVLYWGTSEWAATQIIQAKGICEQMGFQRPSSNQPRYNLYWRIPEHEVFPVCQEAGIGQVVFSPLAHGILTGKYQPGTPPPPGTRAADPDQNAVMMKLYWNDDNLSKSQQFAAIAREMGATPAQLALAWCLRQPILTSAITSGTRVSQLEENLKAAEITVPDDVLTRLDELFPVPKGLEGV
ncbi:MAG: aldo/keto reductase family protein [Candidatus Latescibacteria bacterium]|nr:aldo/keto reductase family protein [Candidatus Latescibacterota bacterium]